MREHSADITLADYPALSVDRAGGGNPLYAEDTPNQEFLIWCAPIQEFLIRCTPIQEFEFTDSVLVFVRGVIWHQAEGYNWNIMSQIPSFLSHVTALAVGSITSLHSKISAICWYNLFV